MQMAAVSSKKYFSPERFAGLWRGVARIPMLYERGVESALAYYALLPGGGLAIQNTGFPGPVTAKGTASPKKRMSDEVAAFSTEIDGNTGEYIIFYIGSGYKRAIVGTRNRKALWFLARERSVTSEEYQAMVAMADELGFDTKKLVPYSSCPQTILDVMSDSWAYWMSIPSRILGMVFPITYGIAPM